MRRYATDLGLLFVVLVWGVSPSLFKIALAELTPLAFVYVRFVLLCVVSLSVLAWRGARGGRAWRIAWRDVGALILSGLSGYGIYQLCYMVGLAHTTVFSSALLAATVPLWSVVIVAALGKERVHALQWAGVIISLGGTGWFLLAAGTLTPETPAAHALGASDQLLGDALTLAAALLFAVYGVVNGRLARRYSPPELMCYTLVVGTLALTPLGLPALLQQDWGRVSLVTWLIIPYSVLFPIYLTYSIWNWAIGRRGVGYVTIYIYLVPILAGVVAYQALGELPPAAQFGAGAVVLGGMLLARVGIVLGQRRGARVEARQGDAAAGSGPLARTPPELVPEPHAAGETAR